VFRHSVLFRFSPETTDDQIEAMANGLLGLPAAIPEIRAYDIGRNVGEANTNWHFAIVADFDSRADWQTYNDHPVHRQVIQDIIQPLVADRAAVQYEFD
jgi:hypothetical protein